MPKHAGIFRPPVKALNASSPNLTADCVIELNNGNENEIASWFTPFIRLIRKKNYTKIALNCVLKKIKIYYNTNLIRFK